MPLDGKRLLGYVETLQLILEVTDKFKTAPNMFGSCFGGARIYTNVLCLQINSAGILVKLFCLQLTLRLEAI